MAIRDHYPHGTFCWVDLAAREMPEAREFYQRLFGWKAVDIDTQGGPPYAHFQLQELPVAGLGQLEQALVDRRTPASWNSYVAVDDIAAVCAQVESLGGKITVPTQRVLDAGSLAFMQDPTGAASRFVAEGPALRRRGAPGLSLLLLERTLHAGYRPGRRVLRPPAGLGVFRVSFSTGQVLRDSQPGEECSGMLQIDHRWGDMRPCWLVYFAVRSVDITVDQVRQLGGWVCVHPFDIEEGRFAIVADGQGGMFDLVQMRDA